MPGRASSHDTDGRRIDRGASALADPANDWYLRSLMAAGTKDPHNNGASPDLAAGRAQEKSAAGGLSYADSGVDIDAGNAAVERIKSHVASTRRPEQLDQLGGFAGMFALPQGYKEPVLVGCTDGVGTKLLVAIALDRHDSVGIDLVAMCVNDLVVTGAEPLFLLDYVATPKLEPAHAEALISGIARGCRESGCALLGGETAELPGLYAPGHYDLAATAVGVVEKNAVLGPQRVREGDVVLGLASSGLHSNGFSLARKALLSDEYAGLSLDSAVPGSGASLGELLLEPTRLYVRSLLALRDELGAAWHAAAHITGGGFLENPQRALPEGLNVELHPGRVDLPQIMQLIADQGVSRQEMLRTFNCGTGMLVYVDAGSRDSAVACLEAAGETVTELGRVVAGQPGEAPQVILQGEN